VPNRIEEVKRMEEETMARNMQKDLEHEIRLSKRGVKPGGKAKALRKRGAFLTRMSSKNRVDLFDE
jgi:hypothetical protein